MARTRATERNLVIAPEVYKDADALRAAFRDKGIDVTREADELLGLAVYIESFHYLDAERTAERITLKVVHNLSVMTAGDQPLQLKNGAHRTVVYEAAHREGLKTIRAATFLRMCLQHGDELDGMPYAGMIPIPIGHQEKIFAFVTRHPQERVTNDRTALVVKDGRANHTFHAACLVAFLDPT